MYIYTLKLKNNKYYVGKTENPSFRLENHFSDCGSKWTQKYTPITIHEIIPNCSDHDEQRVTQNYMKKYGINNVRGGPWCKIKLTGAEIEFIQNIIDSENDNCYKCGQSGHFAKNCTKSYGKKTCERCGRDGHTIKNCYAKTYLDGSYINENDTEEDTEEDIEEDYIWECEYCGKEFDSEKGCRFHENVHCTKRKLNKKYDSSKALFDELYDDGIEKCSRCGRKGHIYNDCYAEYHIKGYYIMKNYGYR